MAGQADEAPTFDDIAAFLVDNPEADHTEKALAKLDAESADDADTPATEKKPEQRPKKQQPGAGPDDDEDETPDEDPGDEPEEDDEDGEPAEARKSLKFKVPVKGEDGADTTIEVDEKELISGYQRHADYTRKTMELATQRDEALQIVQRDLAEGRAHYMQQAAKVRTAIVRLAGLRSPAEMAQLAATDRDAYVQEDARQKAIEAELSAIDRETDAEKQRAEQAEAQASAKAFQAAWGVLGNEGINKEKLTTIFKGIAESYGVPPERFRNVTDPKLVLIFRDAMAYRNAKTKAETVTREKLKAAPALPAPKQSAPRAARVEKTLDNRFRSGKASIKDLGAWIATHR